MRLVRYVAAVIITASVSGSNRWSITFGNAGRRQTITHAVAVTTAANTNDAQYIATNSNSFNTLGATRHGLPVRFSHLMSGAFGANVFLMEYHELATEATGEIFLNLGTAVAVANHSSVRTAVNFLGSHVDATTDVNPTHAMKVAAQVSSLVGQLSMT